MVVFDRDLNMHTFNAVDKFIEIEFNRADQSGLECFVLVVEIEPDISIIVGFNIWK